MIDYSQHRREYERGLEISVGAATNACISALRELGIFVSDKLEEALYLAIENNWR